MNPEKKAELQAELQTHREATEKVVNAVKENPAAFSDAIELAFTDYLKWWTTAEIKTMYPELFK